MTVAALDEEEDTRPPLRGGPVGSISPPNAAIADAAVWDSPSERTTAPHELETRRDLEVVVRTEWRARALRAEEEAEEAREAAFLAEVEAKRAVAEVDALAARLRLAEGRIGWLESRLAQVTSAAAVSVSDAEVQAAEKLKRLEAYAGALLDERDAALSFAEEIEARASADGALLAGERDHALALAAEARARAHRTWVLLTGERDRAFTLLAELEARHRKERAALEGERDEAKAIAAELESRYGAQWRRAVFEEAVDAVMFGRTEDGLAALKRLASLDPDHAEYREWITQAESFVSRERGR